VVELQELIKVKNRLQQENIRLKKLAMNGTDGEQL
jgi:hypothetical protein